MNHWYNEIMNNNPHDCYYGYRKNPEGMSDYFAGSNNPYSYLPDNNPSEYDSHNQEFVVVNKKRGLTIITDLSYQNNSIRKSKLFPTWKYSTMTNYGFNY
jgi:hypothetical protein